MHQRSKPSATDSNVQTYFDALDGKFCEDVIAGFEVVPNKIPSHIYNNSREDVRSGAVVFLKDITDGAALKEKFIESCDRCLMMFRSAHPGLDSLCSDGFVWTEPRIEKVMPGGGFKWHMDSRQTGNDKRFLTVVCYLNDVTDGGELEFLLTSLVVTPARGLIAMFPPFWTHPHRGRPPRSGPKYAIGCFGFVTAEGNGNRFEEIG